jgi:hypothetical protein
LKQREKHTGHKMYVTFSPHNNATSKQPPHIYYQNTCENISEMHVGFTCKAVVIFIKF